MENGQIINDLKELISIVNDGKEGYQSAADATERPALKAEFLKFTAERAIYEAELKAHLLKHGAVSENDTGGVLGVLHRTWIDIKQALSSKEDVAILSAIITGENAALAKYDEALANQELHQDHLYLLKSQRDGILNALKEVEVLYLALNN